MQTFQEVVDLIRLLNKEFPRTVNAERKVGIYVEIKDWQWNFEYAGHNQADMVYDLLVKNGLDTIEKSKEDIPVVIQSFELPALQYFRKLTDLPSTLVMGVDRSNYLQQLWSLLESLILMKPDPYIDRGFSPDWRELSKIVNGITPYHQLITKPGALTDANVDDWDRFKMTDDKYSDFIAMMHSLDIAVHPWPLKDDYLNYRKTAYAETKMFVNKGVDGFFVEFPADSLKWFT